MIFPKEVVFKRQPQIKLLSNIIFMTLNHRVNVLLIIFSILYILSSCSIVERMDVIFPRLISTILNFISFLSSIVILCFYRFGIKIIQEIGSSRFLFFCFYLSCSFFAISYCCIMFCRVI